MNDRSAATSIDTSRQYLPVLLLLFIGSGCAALIYEIVWFQLLQLVIGSSAVSLGVLLGTFMGGMCLGSFLLPRYIDAQQHPLRVYAFLELGHRRDRAAPAVRRCRSSTASTRRSAAASLSSARIVASICLLPPTLLMGATLPAMARWVETTPKGVSWLGFFYGGNIAGAVIGSLLAGFYLLRVFDMAIATYVAVALNVAVVAFGRLAIAKRARRTQRGRRPRTGRARGRRRRAVYVTIALSGMTALAAEVHLDAHPVAALRRDHLHVLADSGGLPVRPRHRQQPRRGDRAREPTRPRVALGWCQMLLCGAMAWAAYMLTQSLPYWPINPSISHRHLVQLPARPGPLPLGRAAGARFCGARASRWRWRRWPTRGQDPGRLVGGVYAANTVGAIVGSLVGQPVCWSGGSAASTRSRC